MRTVGLQIKKTVGGRKPAKDAKTPQGKQPFDSKEKSGENAEK